MPFVRQSARGTAGGADALADDRALASSRRPGDGARAARPAPVQELERVITRGRGVCQPREGRAARSSRAVTCPYPRARAGTGTSHLFFIGFAGRGAALRAGTRLRRSRPGPRRSRRATTSAAASRPAGGMGPRTEGGVSFLRAGAQLVTASGEQAFAQRAGPIAMAGQGPVPHRPAGAGRTPPSAGCDRLRGEGRPASRGPGCHRRRHRTRCRPFPRGRSSAGVRPGPPVLPRVSGLHPPGPRATRPLRPPPVPARLCRTARQRHDRS